VFSVEFELLRLCRKRLQDVGCWMEQVGELGGGVGYIYSVQAIEVVPLTKHLLVVRKRYFKKHTVLLIQGPVPETL